MGQLYGVPKSHREKRSEELIQLFRLEEKKNLLFSGFSKLGFYFYLGRIFIGSLLVECQGLKKKVGLILYIFLDMRKIIGL